MIISRKSAKRKGMILLVVVAFLALFTIMGTTYVMLADTFRRGSEADMDATDVRTNPIKMPDIDPRYMFNFALERLLYDQEDVTQNATGAITNPTPKGVYNPLRGHSFARNMYGWDNSYINAGTANAYMPLNDKPFNGHGRDKVLANSIPSAGSVTLPGVAQPVPEWKIVNHTYFTGGPLIDPQRGSRTAANPNPISSTWNASYTGPDFNSMFLGNYVTGVNPTPANPNGNTVIIPSFHRSYLFGNTDVTSIPTITNQPSENANWINSSGKYFTLRPRPVDNLTAADAASVAGNANATINMINQRISESKLFPYPDSDGLDVKNLEGYPGGNDSMWIDAGYPVMTTADGRKYKVLIAPLVLDLDGRINLNVAGNLMQRKTDPSPSNDPNYPLYNADHASNQGWGRWEINPQKLVAGYSIAPPGHPNNPLYVTQNPYPSMATATAENEMTKFLAFKVPTNPMTEPGTTGSEKSAITNASGNQIGMWQNFGRFFESRYLPVNNNPPPITNFSVVNAHAYAMVDYNGAGDYQPPMGMNQPWGQTSKPTLNNPNGWPSFGNGFGNGKANEHLLDGTNNNTNYHAQNFNPYRTKSGNTGISSVFPVSETAAVLRWQGTGEPYGNSKLGQLMPKALGLDMPYDVSSPDGAFRQKTRNSITTISADLDRPGVAPVIPDQPSPYAFTLKIGDFGFPERVTKAPPANPMTAGVPNVYKPIADQPTTSNQTSPALKINLNRNLTQFPALVTTPTSMMPADQDRVNYVDWTNNSAQFKNAIQDRTNLAKKIYETLRNVTGVIKLEDAQAALANMATPNADKMSITTDLVEIKRSNRWLAQLAANIVDYIDSDDYNTAFQWTGDTQDWVFGVEMPRVVINEVYTMAQNDSGDGFNNNQNATMDTHFHTAIELLNPLPNDSSYGIAPGGHTAVLRCKDANGTDIKNYKLVLCSPNQIAGRLNDVVGGQYFNKTGAYDFNGTNVAMDKEGGGKAILDDWTDVNFMPPMAPNPATVPPTWLLAANNGTSTMVVADDTTLRMEANPQINPTMKSSQLKLKNLDKAMNPTDNHAPEVVLQKLVYPGLPENDYDPMNPGVLVNPGLPYNPYITVDIFSKHKMWDLRKYDSTAAKNPDVTTTNSYGRKAPFLDSAGLDLNNFNANWYNGNNSGSQNGGAAAKNTMGAPNSNLSNPLPWLVHLDRQLINSMELLHVSTGKPHELTQTANRWADVFTQSNPQINMMTGQPEFPARTSYPYVSNWPWYDENTRLHRFLEAVTVTPLQSGEIQHGRVLGKVNVNTMHGEEVFQAVADAAPANNFTQADVTTAYTNLMGQRPITGFGQANNADFSGPTSKSGMNKSLLGFKAFDATNAGNVEIPNGNMLDVQGFANAGANAAPYPRKELLTKVGNSTTTRSNVFGVWITTGYFEVTDDATYPPKLGAEIGKADGVNIRHRMFSIVDRTQMVSMATALKYSPVGGPQTQVLNAVTVNNGMETLTPLYQAPTNTPIQAGMTVAGWQGGGTNHTGRKWAFQDKMLLTFDPGTDNEETVELRLNTTATPQRLEATFTKPHAYGCTIINRGNPGPWSGYNYKADTQVVPYVEFIE